MTGGGHSTALGHTEVVAVMSKQSLWILGGLVAMAVIGYAAGSRGLFAWGLILTPLWLVYQLGVVHGRRQ